MVADVARTARYTPAIPYGLGVQAVTIDGHPTLGHSGRFLGSRAAVRWLPSERIAIAVLTNQSRTDPNRLVAALLKLALQPEPDRLPGLHRPASLTLGAGAVAADPRSPGTSGAPTGTVGSSRARTGRGDSRTTPGKGSMAIRVDAYTSGGMASGILARPGHLRDALEEDGSLPLDRRRTGRLSTTTAASGRGLPDDPE